MVATTYRGKPPAGAVMPDSGRYLNWIKCATCRAVTLHAQLQDAPSHYRPGGSTACAGERDNVEQTKAQRELAPLVSMCEARGITIEWVDDLPQWEKRKQSDWWTEIIVGELVRADSSAHHLRVLAGQPPTKTASALRKSLDHVTRAHLEIDMFYGICGCGWDITVCSYCPGEGWRWKG